MSTGAKIALWIGIPLVIIIIMYVIFFGFKRPSSASASRIAEIESTLQNSRLSADDMQALMTERQILLDQSQA